MNMESTKAAKIVNALAGTHERGEPPDIYSVFADFSAESLTTEKGWWLGMVRTVCGNTSLPTDLFLAKASCTMGRTDRFKEWGYLTAAKFVGARASEQRRRSTVGAYRTDWGHQAARDGLALAIWGGKHPDLIYNGLYVVNGTGWCEVPGRDARAKQFGCTKEAYQAVRDEVGSRANDLITEAAHWLEMCMLGNYNGEFIRRWEYHSGNPWPGGGHTANPH